VLLEELNVRPRTSYAARVGAEETPREGGSADPTGKGTDDG